MKDKDAWVQTFTGKQFHVFDPSLHEISIIDIAHSLSLVCRFNGHCKTFYSVAEHSWRASFLVQHCDALAALMHDASEAYLSDISKPVKPHLANYYEIEDGLMVAIAKKYKFQYPLPPSVKEADVTLLFTEKRDLMGPEPFAWTGTVKPLTEVIAPMTPAVAKDMFLKRFAQLSMVA